MIFVAMIVNPYRPKLKNKAPRIVKNMKNRGRSHTIVKYVFLYSQFTPNNFELTESSFYSLT